MNKKKQSKTRRRFIKAGLVAPILSILPWNASFANQLIEDDFQLPEKLYHEVFEIYGEQVNDIVLTDRLNFVVPDIAENGAVVPISVRGEQNYVSSLVIFAEVNPKPLSVTCTFHEGSDLSVSTRIKLASSSDLYLIAQTNNGLVGVKKSVKVTLGCGGG